MSLYRWVFKWRLKVRMFSRSRMSAGREFRVDGAATEKAQRANSVVYARNDEHRSVVAVTIVLIWPIRTRQVLRISDHCFAFPCLNNRLDEQSRTDGSVYESSEPSEIR